MSVSKFINKKLFLAGAVVALATACCFHQLVLHPGDLLVGCQRNGFNDITAYFLSSKAYPGIAWSQFGQLPLWNPFVLAGTPFTGNPQSGLFYPPNSIFLFLKPGTMISWMLVLHHFWAGFGTVVLSRRYGLSVIGSVAAGIIFLSAPFLVAQTGEGHYNQICAISWIPWAFLAWERLKQRRRGSVVVMALVMAMCFFCGHAQEVAYLGLILTFLTIAEIVRLAAMERQDDARCLLQQWLLSGIGTLGLVAVDLMPAWYYTRLSNRSGRLSVEDADAAGLRLSNLWQLLDPFVLGHPSQPLNDQATDFYWESVCYFGLVPSLLAVIGITLGFKSRQQPREECPDQGQQAPRNWATPLRIYRHVIRGLLEVPAPPGKGEKVAGGGMSGLFAGSGPLEILNGVGDWGDGDWGVGDRFTERKRATRLFAMLWIFALAFAFGAGSAVYELCHRFLPGVAMFRIPSRMLFFAAFAVAMLAGIGIDVFAGNTARIRPGQTLLPKLLAGLALITAGLMLAAFLRDTPSELPAVPAETSLTAFTLSPKTWSLPGNWKTWAWLTAGLSLICSASLARKRRTPILCAVVALALLETSLHAHQVLRTAPPGVLRSGGSLSDVPGLHEGLFRTLVQQHVLSDQEAAHGNIRKVQGYEPVCLLPYVAAFRSALPETPNFIDSMFGFAPINLNDFSKPVIDMLGVRWAVITSDEQGIDEQEIPAGWKRVASGIQPPFLTLRDGKAEMTNYEVWENTSPLPRAMVVGQATTLKAGEDSTAALARCNFREEVLLLKDVLPDGPRAEPRESTIERYTPNEVVIQVDATAPGYLVLSDAWSPGWTATVDGASVGILRANMAFRAVLVPPGKHTVQFQFWPPGLSAGATISLLTATLLLCMSFRRHDGGTVPGC